MPAFPVFDWVDLVEGAAIEGFVLLFAFPGTFPLGRLAVIVIVVPIVAVVVWVIGVIVVFVIILTRFFVATLVVAERESMLRIKGG
jgi:hypothetical protein